MFCYGADTPSAEQVAAIEQVIQEAKIINALMRIM